MAYKLLAQACTEMSQAVTYIPLCINVFHHYYRRPYVYQCGDLDKLINTVLEKVESLPVERVVEVLNGFLERYVPQVLVQSWSSLLV